MAIVVPNSIEEVIAQYILTTADLKLRLYSNNYAPAENAVIASFTEVTGGGYAAKTLSSGSWTITIGNPTEGVYAAQTFSFTGTIGGSGVVYGYYVTNTAGTTLYWAESLPSAVNPFTPGNGSYVRITPRFQVS